MALSGGNNTHPLWSAGSCWSMGVYRAIRPRTVFSTTIPKIHNGLHFPAPISPTYLITAWPLYPQNLAENLPTSPKITIPFIFSVEKPKPDNHQIKYSNLKLSMTFKSISKKSLPASSLTTHQNQDIPAALNTLATIVWYSMVVRRILRVITGMPKRALLRTFTCSILIKKHGKDRISNWTTGKAWPRPQLEGKSTFMGGSTKPTIPMGIC